MLSRQQFRIAAFSTAVFAFAALNGSALAQKKYDTGATDSEIRRSAISCPTAVRPPPMG